VLLALVGGGAGLALAFWGIRLHTLIVPDDFPDLLRHVRVDMRVLAFALGARCSRACCSASFRRSARRMSI
jgi:hypothetical protein